MRYLLYLTVDPNNREAHFLIDRRNDFWYVPFQKLHFPIPRDTSDYHVDTIIDGELVMDKLPGGGYQAKYLVFDCMVLDGNSLMSRTLDKRLAYFKERVMDPYLQLLQEYPTVGK
jgi:mRNA guanylyltransferase